MSEAFNRDLEQVLNKHSQENASNTPDFILAQFLRDCLHTFNCAVTRRADWYGRYDKPGSSSAAGAPSAQQPLDGSQNIPGWQPESRAGLASESVTRGNLPPSDASKLAAAALDWYGEQAMALVRFAKNADAQMAVMTALTLDAGQRAEKAIEALCQRDQKLQAFKDYVHQRLDAMGVPVDPESPHKAEGCRIGGRLDCVENRIGAVKRYDDLAFALGCGDLESHEGRIKRARKLASAAGVDVAPAVTLWIDCEFNEFKGALISMALVDERGRQWSEVVECSNPGPWVAQNVMPILGKEAVSYQEMQASLQRFLAPYQAIHIVADWPEDVKHFCEALITGPGCRFDTPPLTMEVVRIDAFSEQPHNALSDAWGIRAAMLGARNRGEPGNCDQLRPGQPCPTPNSCRDNGCDAVERELFPRTVAGEGKRPTLHLLEMEIRGLSGVSETTEGTLRISLVGLRETRAKSWVGASRRELPSGQRAECNCCGEMVGRFWRWNLLHICDPCWCASEAIAPTDWSKKGSP